MEISARLLRAHGYKWQLVCSCAMAFNNQTCPRKRGHATRPSEDIFSGRGPDLRKYPNHQCHPARL